MKLVYQNSSLVSDEQISQTGTKLTDYIKHLQRVVEENNYNYPESSINLPHDNQLLETVNQVVQEKVNTNLKYFIDIGIGGSNLGTKAIYDALFGYFDVIEPERFPKMVFADTNDPEFLNKLVKLLSTITNPEEILINLISKSGTTTETIANGQIILSALSQNFEVNPRLVVTTDEGSKLWQWAQENNITSLSIPQVVGGRFAVFSPVGLFPLASCGIDIQKLREGALPIRELYLSESIDQNPALVSAIILYQQNQQGKNINDNFIFHPELESLGKWYRQLIGESIGKTSQVGITPTVSIGSTDLHSMGQLYLGGPNDKVTTFIYSDQSETLTLPQSSSFDSLVPGISGKSVKNIMDAIMQGTKIAYQKKGLAYMEVMLEDISEKSLGEFLQFKMLEIIYLGKLLNVNTFDQPNVEDYKVETKKILSDA